MFYRLVRAIVRFALHLLYRVRVHAAPAEAVGPVIYVSNHPNGLVDPALIFVITPRPVTFLAKAPLFQIPLLGRILRGLRALPVYRKQDDARLMSQNEGTFEAATGALVAGRALMLFPEGKSHSEPSLAELKTGAARMALRAASQGAPVKIVPVGLTYEEKQRFRSEVLIEVGGPIDVAALLPGAGDSDRAAVQTLTEAIAAALKQVTLNLAHWEDLPLIRTAEELYALRTGDAPRDADRTRLFARGVQIFRAEQPERFEKIREELMSFGGQLLLVKANPRDLTIVYRPLGVLRFTLRNLVAVAVGLPLFALGVILFVVPYYLARVLASFRKWELEDRATILLIATLLVGPVWTVLLAIVAWLRLGPLWGIGALLLSPPLALFTWYFYERRRSALRDARTFLVLGSRSRLKQRLLGEGERLATAVEQIAEELRPRVVGT